MNKERLEAILESFAEKAQKFFGAGELGTIAIPGLVKIAREAIEESEIDNGCDISVNGQKYFVGESEFSLEKKEVGEMLAYLESQYGKKIGLSFLAGRYGVDESIMDELVKRINANSKITGLYKFLGSEDDTSVSYCLGEKIAENKDKEKMDES